MSTLIKTAMAVLFAGTCSSAIYATEAETAGMLAAV